MSSRPVVMISSTARDLPLHRDQVRLACERVGFAPHEMMENLDALDANAIEASLNMVDDADVYIGIFAFRYGYVPDGAAVSVTEMEYNRAVEADKPRLIFFMDDDHPITFKMVEIGDGATKLAALKERVGKDRVAGFFKSPDGLLASVTNALHALKTDIDKKQPKELHEDAPFKRPSPAKASGQEPLGPNPYVGLEAFRLEDADRFFGREDLVKKLWQRFFIIHGQDYLEDSPVRLLAILGASGSGKSSVAQAGLLAEIQKQALPGRHNPKLAVFTPETRPLESLAMALAKVATDDTTPVGKAQEFEKVLRERKEDDGLRFLADSFPDKPHLILLVDQFEEVYSLCDDKDERKAFINNLLNAARNPNGPLSVLLTLRSDFLGAVNDHREFSNLIATQHEVVPVMKETDLRRAIEEPAKAAGRPLDPAVVDLLIEQSSGEQGALPLLEFALRRIWEGLRQGKAETDTLRKLGGVGGALAKEATSLFAGLHEKEKAIAKRAFLAMVHLGEGTRDTRRRAQVKEIVAASEAQDEVERVLALFANPERRLITLSGTQQGEPTVEVSHEALIEHWSDLKEWLDSERDDERFHRRLNEAAKLWKKGKGGLWRPPELDLLNNFEKRHGKGLTKDELRFYNASKETLEKEELQRKAEVEERQRLERERQQAELKARETELKAQQEATENAEALAREQRERKEDAEAAAARLSRRAIAAGIGLIFAAIAAVVAWQQQQAATAAREIAENSAKELETTNESLEDAS